MIYVDLLEDDQENILLVHGYNGTYDKVSRSVLAYLKSLEVKRRKTPREEAFPREELPDDVISTLRRRGYLTHLSVEEEEELFVYIVNSLHGQILQMAPSYVLMPTYACNLRCPYCFQDHLRSKAGAHNALKIIEPHMVDRIFLAIEKLEEKHSSHSPAKREITLFGGEPLLAASRPVIEYILRKARSLGDFTFKAITNATDLAVYQDLLGEDSISSLQVTLDGSPSEHDKRRIYPDGQGSFHLIADNVTIALEAGVEVAVRVNVDRANVRDLPQLADEFVARHWPEYRSFAVYVSPIRAANEETSDATTFGLWELNRELKALREAHANMSIISTVDSSMRQQAKRIFSQKALHSRMKPSFCGAHSSMLVFDPHGDIYACWERTGGTDLCVGRVEEGGELKMVDERLETWRSRTVTSNPVCRKCRYALHCGGGCAVIAADKSGDFFKNSCDGFASRFRTSVAEAYVESRSTGVDEDPHHYTCGV